MPPSDEEMIRHFATHEAAFRKVYEIMSESSEGSFHYPPLSPEEVIILDSTEQSDTSHETNDEENLPVYGLLKPDRIQLDSLLSEIGCGLVLVDRREWESGIKGAPAGKKFYRPITDDTQPGGPVQRTIEYVAPFDRCDREKDYETAWAFVSKHS